MVHTLETVAEILELLDNAGVQCDLFGGWAEELLGMHAPWQHGDIDLVFRGPDFLQIDDVIKHRRGTLIEIAGKRFRHKRAFLFHGVMCEIVLVQTSDTMPTTFYWGDVTFQWCQPLLHHEGINLCGRAVTAMSRENLRRHRFQWKERQPHRWQDPASLEV